MAYTREWTPTTVDLTNSPRITIRAWNGQTVPGATYIISGNALVITVPTANKYKITVKSGPAEETVQLDIPIAGENTLEVRLRKYVEYLVGTGGGGGGTSNIGNLTPDPDPNYEGYFIITPPEETA